MKKNIFLEITLILLFIYLPLIGGGYFFPSDNLVHLLSLVLLVVVLKKNSLYKRFLLPEISLLLFLFFALLSLVNRVNLYLSRKEIFFIIDYISIFFSVSILTKTGQIYVKKIILYLIISTLVLSIIGILQQVYEFSLLRDEIITGKLSLPSGVFSTFFSKNAFAGYLTIILPLSIFFFLIEKSYKKLIFLISTLLLGTSFLLANSKGAILCSIPSLITFLIFLLSNKKYLSVVFIILTLLTSFFSANFIKSISNVLNNNKSLFPLIQVSYSYSLVDRMGFWKGTINIIKHYPIFGSGAGTFPVILPKYQYQRHYSKYAHNEYLQILSECGPFALLSLMIFFISILLYSLWLTFRILLRNESIPVFLTDLTFISPTFSLVLFLSLFNFLLHIAIDYDWHNPSNTILAFAIAGIINGLFRSQNSEFKIKGSRKSNILVFFIILMGVYMFVIFISEIIYRNGQKMYGKGQLENSIKRIQLSTRLDPINGKFHYSLARLYLIANEPIEKSIEEMQKATFWEPFEPLYRRELGYLLLKKGDESNAIKNFKVVKELHPNAVMSFLLLARLYLGINKINEAENELVEAIKLKEFYLKEPFPQDKFNPYYTNLKALEECYLLLSKINNKKGNHRKAYNYFLIADKIKKITSFGEGDANEKN